jgi:IclR family KDG regulon transcriptional repressor
MTTVRDNTASTLRRGIDLLELLSAPEVVARGGIGAADLARAAGIERSLAFRTLQVLEELELVDRDPTSKAFRPGWRLFSLAACSGDQRLRRLAPPYLAELVAACCESAYLSVRQGQEVLTILTEHSQQVIQAVNWTGQRTPIWCTSAGRALLLDHTRAGLEALLGDGLLGPETSGGRPISALQLSDLIERDRAGGVVVADEEFEPGLFGLAAPVRDFAGDIVAVVNVSGPSFRLRDQIGALSALLRATTIELSDALGWQGARVRHDPVASSAPTGRMDTA